jgi:chromosome segregation ATPase
MLQLNKKFNLHEIEIEKLKYDVSHKIEENSRLQADIKHLNEYKEKSIQLEGKLHLEQNHSQTLVKKIQHLEHDLQIINKTLIEQQNGMQTSNEKILDNFKNILKEQIESNKSTTFTKCDMDELKMRIKELQFKLSQEKLAKESLEIKLKLLESDNQSLRQTLLNSCRFKTTITNRNRIDDINELIERAQLNAQNIIAGNPSLLNLVEIK